MSESWVHGPYNAEDETLAAPLAISLAALGQTPMVFQLGNQAEIVRRVTLRHLENACARAGVELGALDRTMLRFIAESPGPILPQVLIGLISRAYHAGTQVGFTVAGDTAERLSNEASE